MQALLPIDFFLDPQAKGQIFFGSEKIFDGQICYLYHVSKNVFI